MNRTALIDRLVRSYEAMPRWAKNAYLRHLRVDFARYAGFRQELDGKDDSALQSLRDEFATNGDLIP